MADKEFVKIVSLQEGVKKTNDSIYDYVENWIAHVEEKWDDFITDSLYNTYKEMGLTRVLQISKEDFKKFLLWALPKYYKEVLK